MLSGWWGFLSSGCEKPACTPVLAHCWLEDGHISNLHMVWPESESMRSLTQCPETPPLNVIVQFETCVDVESISYYLFIYFPLLVRFNCRTEMHVFIQSDRKYIKSHFAVQLTPFVMVTILPHPALNLSSCLLNLRFAEETFSEILLDCTYSVVT